MRVAVRGLSTCNTDVGTNYIHNTEPTRENVREARELFTQIPRYQSAPTPLTSQVLLVKSTEFQYVVSFRAIIFIIFLIFEQGATVRHSVFSGSQREPLFVRMNDSSVYHRGVVPVLLRPATSPNFPPPVYCNTVQTGT